MPDGALVDDFAAFVADVSYREVDLPWGRAQVWDAGEGAPVVLLHGIASGRRVLFPAVRQLARNHRVIVPPLRGEDRPAPRATFDELLDDLDALLGALDLRDVTLVGMSFGGAVALRFGARRDPRIGRIVVQGTFLRYRPRWPDRMVLLFSGIVPAGLGARYFGWRVLHGPECRIAREHAAGLDTLLADWSRKTPFRSLVRRTRLIGRMDLSADVRRIDVPLTIAHGGRDRVVPRIYFDRLREVRPDARCVLVDHAGHLMSLMQPDAFVALIE